MCRLLDVMCFPEGASSPIENSLRLRDRTRDSVFGAGVVCVNDRGLTVFGVAVASTDTHAGASAFSSRRALVTLPGARPLTGFPVPGVADVRETVSLELLLAVFS